jgi:hypothetical protein
MLNKSQRALLTAFWLGVALFGLTIATFFKHNEDVDVYYVLLLALIQVVQMHFKYKALYWFGWGDEPRRMDQFEDGLGQMPSPIRCAKIEELTGPCDAVVDADYYASKKPQGAKRLVEMLLESSFYTAYIAAKCRRLYFGFGFAGLAIVGTAIFLAIQLRDSQTPSLLTSHILVAAFVFFLTGDFWILGLQYRDLAIQAESTKDAAFQLAGGGSISIEAAVELAMSYNTAVSQAPPLLSMIHWWKGDELDARFKRHFSAVMGL